MVEVHEQALPKHTNASVARLLVLSPSESATGHVRWEPTVVLGRGSCPHIAMNNANWVVEVHQRKVRNIFYSGGVAHVEAKAIAGLCEDSAYEKHKLCDGTSPTVSMNDKGNIAFIPASLFFKQDTFLSCAMR